MSESPRIVHEPDPDNPGWFTWNLADDTRFNAQTMGHMRVRKDSDRLCRVRMFPERRHTNLLDMVHGAISLALMDVALFASMRLLLDADAGGSVTLELSSQFIGAGKPGVPLDAVLEVLRETKRLVFLRGTVVQGKDDEHLIASFSGIVRKPSR